VTTDTLLEKKPDIRSQIDALFKALNAHDVDKIVALHASDAVFEDPTLMAPVRGPKQIGEQFRMMFRAFPDIKFTANEVYLGAPGHAVARWTFVATMTGPMDPPGYAPTGKKATVHGVCVYEMKDGLLKKHTSVYDLMGMLQQVGLMPAMDSAQVKVTAGLQRTFTKLTKVVQRH
jgi:steroid delta-isomerase-like uncharacterized protein